MQTVLLNSYNKASITWIPNQMNTSQGKKTTDQYLISEDIRILSKILATPIYSHIKGIIHVMTVLLKVTYRFNKIPMKMPIALFR